jgi:hypothetical protein
MSSPLLRVSLGFSSDYTATTVVARRAENLGQKGEHKRDPVCHRYNKPGRSEETAPGALQALPNLLRAPLEGGLSQGMKVPREGLLQNGAGMGLAVRTS